MRVPWHPRYSLKRREFRVSIAKRFREELTSGTSYSPPPAFGRFKLLHQIGAGVLGPVFRTHDPEGDRLVAVKAFSLDITPEQAAELAAEFQRLVDLGLETPHLAVPLGTGVEEFVAYLASQYVAGESLDAAIRQYGPAPAGDAARLIGHIAEALDGAARVGVFHGALHPRDILVTPGETHITGMGVAKALERIGLHGPIRRPYVAPERENGEEWGAAADIFSLAAISYEVLTGRRALPGTDQPLAGLADLAARDIGALRDVIETGLDADPERRPSLGADFAVAFANALVEGGVAPAAGDRAAGPRPRKPRVRAPKLPGLDDPLTPASATGTVGPVPPDDPPPADVAGDPSDAPVRELRYEPVDETPPDTLAEVQVEPRAEPVADTEVAQPEAESAPAVAVEPAAVPAVESPAEPAPGPPAEAAPEPPIEPASEPPIEPAPEPPIEPASGPPIEPASEPPIEPAPEPPIEPASGPLLDPVSESPAEPVSESPAEPVVTPPAEVRVRIRRRGGLVAPVVVVDSEAAVPAPDEGRRAVTAPSADAPVLSEAEPLSLPEEPVPPTAEAVIPEPAPAAVEAIREAEPVPLDLLELADEPVAHQPPADLASVDDLKILFSAAGRTITEAGFTPDLGGLAEALSKLEAPGRQPRSGGIKIPADDWLDPGGLASEPAIPRAIDPLASSRSSRMSRTLDPEPYRPDLRVRRTSVTVAVGIGIGLLVAVIAGYLWWAGTSRPESILPPGTVAEVKPAAAATPAATPAAANPGASVPSSAKPGASKQAAPKPPPVPAPAVPAKPRAAAANSPTVAAPAPAATVKPPTGAATPAPAPVAKAPVPAPKAPAGATPAARAGTGDMRVRSTPSNADVVVEGEPRGVTPRTLRGLPYGTYTVRVTRPGYVGQERQVTLDARHRDVPVNFTLARVKAAATPAPPPGKPAAREATVNPTAVVVATSISIETRPPGVRVRLDGKDVGVSPMTISPVTPGSHRVDLSLPGYKRWSTTVTVVVGTRERVTASLERDTPR